MKITDLHPFDPITYLNDEEDVMGYLHSVIEENHPKTTAAALYDVARARRRLHLTTPFDPADYLTDEAHTTAYLQIAAEEAAENGDNSILLDAIQTAARAYGMTEGETVADVLNALGMTITLTPRKTAPN